MYCNVHCRMGLLSIILVCMPACGNSQTKQSGKSSDTIRQLFGKAVSGLPSPETVHQIAISDDPDKVRLLAIIAKELQPDGGNRLVSISELARIGSPDAMEDVAELLAPHQAIEIRLHATEALKNSQCSERCLKTVMFYLYRLFSGEQAQREQLLREAGRRIIEEGQEKVVSGLNSVLMQHRTDVLKILGADYGLGSDEPSPFSLEMVERLRFQEACDLLRKSEEYQRKWSRLAKSDPAHMTKTIEALGCRSGN
jgi:hypothetical protein